MLSGEKTTECSNCKLSTTTTVNPLFTTKGFSIPEKNGDEIAIGYNIDNAAISEYESITGKTLEYGVFATLFDNIGVNEIINADGTTPTGVVVAGITKDEYVAVEFKLSGFVTDNQKLIKLAMGAYLIETDSTSRKLHYLQAEKPTENEKYSYITYNNVLTTTK